MSTENFDASDYTIFAITLLLSGAIGVYYAIKDRKKQSPDEILLGSKHMPMLPTALSLLTSFLSGVTLLGTPAETYTRGAAYWFSRVTGAPLAVIFAMFVVLPILWKLNPISVYQYMEERFSRPMRLLCSFIFLIFMIFYMAVVLYSPAVAMSAVSGVPAWVFFITVGLIGNLYTSFGGLKAVVWADTLQAGFMIAGCLTLFFVGAVRNGGLLHTFKTAAEHGRFQDFANWDPNPFQYITMWTSLLGGIGFWLSLLSFNQISVQRYLSLKSLKASRQVLLLNIPGYIIFTVLADLLGIVMFTYFLGCDPIHSKQIKHKDQLVIHYALKMLGNLPCLPGLFLAGLFSGTLSTLSSGINSMAAVTWEDFLAGPLTKRSVLQKSHFITLVALGYGFLTIVMAFAAAPLGGIINMVMSVMGSTGGPLSGAFILGMCFPIATNLAAMVSICVSFVLVMTIAVGSALFKPYRNYQMPLYTYSCNITNFTLYSNNGTKSYDMANTLTGWQYIFGLSPVVYPFVGIVLVLIIALPISFAEKLWNEYRNPEKKRKSIRHLTIFGINCNCEDDIRPNDSSDSEKLQLTDSADGEISQSETQSSRLSDWSDEPSKSALITSEEWEGSGKETEKNGIPKRKNLGKD